MLRRLALPAICALLVCQPVLAREVSTRTWVENGVTWTETTVVEVEEPGSERLVGTALGPALTPARADVIKLDQVPPKFPR